MRTIRFLAIILFGVSIILSNTPSAADSKDSPGETVKTFLTLVNEGKATTAKEHSHGGSSVVDSLADELYGKIKNVKILKENIKGEQAEVIFETGLNKKAIGGENASLIYNKVGKLNVFALERCCMF